MLVLVAAESIDQELEIDRLYSLPAGEFVAARNQLAKRLRQAGDRAAADRVKRLPRPSQTAWAVNQLAFRAGAELEGLRAAGETVRAAHLAGPKQQQAAAKARRDAISTLRVIAEAALQETGVSPNRSHRQRLTQTLEVLSSQGSEADQVRAGRLSTDLEPAGFDALNDLAAALAAAQKARPRVTKKARPASAKPDESRSRPPAQPATPRVVEHPAASARKAEMEARRAAERRQLERRRDEAREQLERLEEKVGGLRQAAEDAVSGLDQAKQTEADLAQAAREAERLAREARARADAAVALAARARQASESAAAAQRRAEVEIAQARQELERIEEAGK